LPRQGPRHAASELEDVLPGSTMIRLRGIASSDAVRRSRTGASFAAIGASSEESWRKPTRGFEPRTPSLEVMGQSSRRFHMPTLDDPERLWRGTGDRRAPGQRWSLVMQCGVELVHVVREFGARAHGELAIDPAQVRFDGFDGHEECRGRLLV
jgi:hypothetical protein